MPSKVRYVLQYSDRIYAGPDAKRVLRDWEKSSWAAKAVKKEGIPRWQYLAALAQAAGAKHVWVYREPRRVNPKRSRYAYARMHYGIWYTNSQLEGRRHGSRSRQPQAAR